MLLTLLTEIERERERVVQDEKVVLLFCPEGIEEILVSTQNYLTFFPKQRYFQ